MRTGIIQQEVWRQSTVDTWEANASLSKRRFRPHAQLIGLAPSESTVLFSRQHWFIPSEGCTLARLSQSWTIHISSNRSRSYCSHRLKLGVGIRWIILVHFWSNVPVRIKGKIWKLSPQTGKKHTNTAFYRL